MNIALRCITCISSYISNGLVVGWLRV